MGGKTEDRIQKSWQPREILMCLFSVSAIAAFIAYYYSTTNFATAQAIDIGDAQNWKRPEQTEQPLRQRDPHWGSWKPGLYFGLRSHHYPAFTSTGIMWTKEHMTVLRHAAKQDEVSLFEWIRHDGKRYGKHLITDEEMGTKIMSSFAIPIKSSAATWAQRFEISSVGDPLSFFFYFGSDCDGNLPEKSCFGINPSEFTYISEVFESKASESDPAKSLIVRGRSDLSGSFEVQFHMTADGENDMSYWSPSRQTLPYVVKKVQDYVSSNKLHSIRKDNIFRNDSTFRFSNRWSHNSSALAIQLSVSGAATLDILYKEYIDNSDGGSSESSVNDNPYMTKSLISKWMQELEHDFEDRYNRSYGCKGPKLEASHAETSKKIISAVVGGIGLFMGYPNIGNSSSHQILNSNSQIQAVHGAPVQLLTGTPSRTSFPRGFLWDEGFHLMVSSQWSMDIGIDIISSWLESMFTLSYSLGKTGNMNTFGKSEAGQTASSSLGWIPREMILGRDARNVVPAEFVLQRVDIANPPSIMLVIERMIDEATLSQLQQQTCDAKTVSKICSSEKNADVDELREFLLKQYSALCNWLRWFFVTQRGPNRVPGSFRWRGRSASDGKLLSNTLASGLDDYPRAAFPNEDEYHVDLLCWIIKFTSIMAKIDVFLKHDDTFYQKHFFSVVPEFLMGDKSNALYKAKSFQELSNALSTNLDQLHWSERHAMYADVGLHSEVGRIVEEFVYRCMNPISRETKDIGIAGKIFFSRNKDLSSYCPEGFSKGYPLGGDNNGYLSREKYDIKKGSEKIQHVPHVGYVSLFPFLLTIIPTDSPKLDSVLNILEHNLLTSYGLRSLSINNTFYGKSNAPGDNPYWRGYIWLNINYLAVVSLKHYAAHANLKTTRARCSDLYSTLRSRLLDTVLGEYERTGYLWEQYSDESGRGIRGHPFSGWTALVVNLMSESY